MGAYFENGCIVFFLSKLNMLSEGRAGERRGKLLFSNSLGYGYGECHYLEMAQ